MPKKIYIAGPMTGQPEFNHPAFHLHAIRIEKQGHIAINPAVLPLGLEHQEYMSICLPMLRVADEVHMLPGWQYSKGATAEHDEAIKHNMPIHYVNTQEQPHA